MTKISKNHQVSKIEESHHQKDSDAELQNRKQSKENIKNNSNDQKYKRPLSNYKIRPKKKMNFKESLFKPQSNDQIIQKTKIKGINKVIK